MNLHEYEYYLGLSDVVKVLYTIFIKISRKNSIVLRMMTSNLVEKRLKLTCIIENHD